MISCPAKLEEKRERERERKPGKGKWEMGNGEKGRTVNWTFAALQLGKLKIYYSDFYHINDATWRHN